MNSTNELRTDFDELLKAWNHHQDLRQKGAGVTELAASRLVLDTLRFA